MGNISDKLLDQKIVEFLEKLPNINDSNNRRAFIYSASLDDKLQTQISFDGSTEQFFQLLVRLLIEYGILKNGRHPLIAVLEAAKKLIGQDRQTECKKLIQELQEILQKPSSNKSVELPFVVVAMKKDEAENLFEETVSNIETKYFHALKEKLQNVDILSRYKEQRDQWIPFSHGQFEIRRIIEGVINWLNWLNKTKRLPSYIDYPDLPLVNPRFFSEKFFGEDNYSETFIALKKYYGKSCIIIVDMISLYHPKLRDRLSIAELTSEENVSMLFLSPLSFGTEQINMVIEEEIKTKTRPFTFVHGRFYEDLDPFCTFLTGGIQTLQRWLYLLLPIMIRNLERQISTQNKFNFKQFTSSNSYNHCGIGEIIPGIRSK